MEKKAEELDEFYSWECISFIAETGYTLDLVIKDERHMMAALNVFGRVIYGQPDSKFLKVFLERKFHAKLGFQCWHKQITFRQCVLQAIL